jgi:hypothetical protein
MANLTALQIRILKARQAGARLGRAARASPRRHEPAIAAARFETPDDLRQQRRERRTFEALWLPDASDLARLLQLRATRSEISDWAEERWSGHIQEL